MKTLKSFLPVVFIFTLIFALTLPLFTVGAATLIDDIFADGNSTVQNLPNNSLAIYKARSATVRTDAVGSVEYNMTATGTGSEAFWAYFTNSGAPVNLGVGDAITFSGTFSLQGFANNGSDIRFGLFNSNGSRVTADKTSGQSDANFADDTGYGA
ncbi:MAG TPA: hypothetical protein VEX64_10305, partial [Pyrinomonadaceae bacterium]|nr:hypothetical protein [Pyrinomonadaceae bacterium]